MLRIGALLIALVIAAPPALAEASRDCASNNHEAGDPGLHAADPEEPAQRRLLLQSRHQLSRTRQGRPGARRLQPGDRAQSALSRGAQQPRHHLPQPATTTNARLQDFTRSTRGQSALCDRAQQPRRSAREHEPARGGAGGLQPRDRAQSEIRARLRQPRRHLAQDGQARGRDRRLPARLEPRRATTRSPWPA